jgi:3-isopropylmalate dehydratase small subunit
LTHRKATGSAARRTSRGRVKHRQPQYAGATILVAGTDFGTGSSREHAVWALTDYGFRAVIAPRFGDIFRTNATKAGLLPVILPEAIVSALQDAVEADPGTEVTVDLGRREVRAGAAGRRARPARAVRAARRAQLGRRARATRRARRGSGLRSRSTNIPAGG